jgi:hypothetical protein
VGRGNVECWVLNVKWTTFFLSNVSLQSPAGRPKDVASWKNATSLPTHKPGSKRRCWEGGGVQENVECWVLNVKWTTFFLSNVSLQSPAGRPKDVASWKNATSLPAQQPRNKRRCWEVGRGNVECWVVIVKWIIDCLNYDGNDGMIDYDEGKILQSSNPTNPDSDK